VPFKSKKQEQYLRLNEPEVYSDWKNKYGSYKGAETFDAEGNTQWDKTLAMINQYDMNTTEGSDYSYIPEGEYKSELPSFFNKELVDKKWPKNKETIALIMDWCGDGVRSNGTYEGTLYVGPNISEETVVKQLQDWGIDTSNHKKWKNFGYFSNNEKSRQEYPELKIYQFPIPNTSLCQWSNAYVRDTEYDDDGTAYTTFGQDCIKCDNQRRGTLGGDVSWDKKAESFNAEEWWEEYRDELEAVDKSSLDDFELMIWNDDIVKKHGKAKMMQLIINTGEYSTQLSPQLAKIARKQEEDRGEWDNDIGYDPETFNAEKVEIDWDAVAKEEWELGYPHADGDLLSYQNKQANKSLLSCLNSYLKVAKDTVTMGHYDYPDLAEYTITPAYERAYGREPTNAEIDKALPKVIKGLRKQARTGKLHGVDDWEELSKALKSPHSRYTWGQGYEGSYYSKGRKGWFTGDDEYEPLNAETFSLEEGGFYQLEVKYKMEDGWEHYGDYDNEQDAINAYYDIYLKHPEVKLLEVDSEGEGEVLWVQRNFDLDAETFNAESFKPVIYSKKVRSGWDSSPKQITIYVDKKLEEILKARGRGKRIEYDYNNPIEETSSDWVYVNHDSMMSQGTGFGIVDLERGVSSSSMGMFYDGHGNYDGDVVNFRLVRDGGTYRYEDLLTNRNKDKKAESFNAQTATPISPPSKAPKCKCMANRDDATWDERRLGVKGITMSGPFYAKENGKEKAYWACQYCGPQWEDKLVLESEATATMKSALYSLTAVGVGVYIFKNFVMDRLPQRGEE
jgi:hypothetical protein